MERKLIIAANWKMNKGPAETAAFIESFLPRARELAEACDIVIAPPFVSIPAASGLLVMKMAIGESSNDPYPANRAMASAALQE